MIDEHVPGEGSQPGVERSPVRLIAAHGPIQPDKYLLGKILSVSGRAGKTIANVVDTPVLMFDELLPCGRIACDASTNQGIGERVFFQPVWASFICHSRFWLWCGK